MNINRIRCDVCEITECEPRNAEKEGWKRILFLPIDESQEKRNGEVQGENDTPTQNQDKEKETDDEKDICPSCLKTLRKPKEDPLPKSSDNGFVPRSIEDWEKIHIRETLDHTQWNKSNAAHILDIERSTLDRKLKKYEVERPSQL